MLANSDRPSQVRPRIIHYQLHRYVSCSVSPDVCIFIPLAGYTRIDRLHHIGAHSPYLAADAYRLAIAEAKKGKNVELYTKLVDEYSRIAPQDPAAVADTTWIERQTRVVREEHDRLEHELKSYKNNLIKESIRVSEDMGYVCASKLTLCRWATRTSVTSTTTPATSAAHTKPT